MLLVKEVEKFRDSYSLTKVLAWKFDIISAASITERLEAERLITSTIENGISKYQVTDIGVTYVKSNMDEGRNLLLQKYKNDQSFIEDLLK